MKADIEMLVFKLSKENNTEQKKFTLDVKKRIHE
jgi:hypothetical protein